MKANSLWFKNRKALYLKVRQAVESRLGHDSSDLKSYRLSYERQFNQAYRKVTVNHFIRKVVSKKLILIGDFHSLSQSQRTQLRILRKIVVNSKKPIVLGLECINSEHQQKIDSYISGKISEKRFLKDVNWKESWGFSWDQYKPLFEFAMKHNILVVGLNCSVNHRTKKTLEVRDRWAAKVVHSTLIKYPDHQMVVAYGDLHLGAAHLPKQLLKIGVDLKQTQIVFQNPEKLYFKIAEKGPKRTPEIVELSDGAYCLFNSPPWVMWQNYQLFLDAQLDLQEDEEELEAEQEYGDLVSANLDFLQKDLGLKVSSLELDVISVHDSSAIEVALNKMTSSECKVAIRLMLEGKSFYLPEGGQAFLAKSAVNHISKVAMMYLIFQLLKTRQGSLPRSLFGSMSMESLIWFQALVYFGAKLVNHNIKASTVMDLNLELYQSPNKEDREVLKLALAQKMQELMKLNAKKGAPKIKRLTKDSYLIYRASELLGCLLGEKIYSGFSKKKLSVKKMKEFLSENFLDEHFVVRYYELLTLLDHLPIPFQTKSEKI